MHQTKTEAASLVRAVGVPGAVSMGLGSILGTGIFVSVGIAAGIAGTSLLVAVFLAAWVATANGLSSAQLAATYPVSGGTYEYATRTLGSYPGFLAGWMFLCAKSASAATAALGFSGYLLASFGRHDPWEARLLGLALVATLTALVAGGIHRSNRFNAAMVGCTVAVLLALVVAGAPLAVRNPGAWLPGGDGSVRGLLHGTALMFVAYTGYGRIATLGEEVRDPRRNIPRAIALTLLLSFLLYGAVTAVALASVGADGLAEATLRTAAPLERVAILLGIPAWLVSLAAITAMVGVTLNLLLGLSRVVLAMARRRDLPAGLGAIDRAGSPRKAVFLCGALIAALVLVGSVRTTWSFSAFTVLIYYAITNVAALRLAPGERWLPRWVSVAGLVSCLGLAFWVEPSVWLVGLGLLAAGAAWHGVARRLRA